MKENNKFFVIVDYKVVIYVGVLVKKGFLGRFFCILLLDFVFDKIKLKDNVKLYIGKNCFLVCLVGLFILCYKLLNVY